MLGLAAPCPSLSPTSPVPSSEPGWSTAPRVSPQPSSPSPPAPRSCRAWLLVTGASPVQDGSEGTDEPQKELRFCSGIYQAWWAVGFITWHCLGRLLSRQSPPGVLSPPASLTRRSVPRPPSLTFQASGPPARDPLRLLFLPRPALPTTTLRVHK